LYTIFHSINNVLPNFIISRINYNKTKAISIGTARHRKPKFNKISWIKENVKTLGIHHGYNVDNDKIWKDIIDRMKNCIQVWKSRKLSIGSLIMR
jgi:molybdopterin synthase catalytic subunit